MLLKEIRNECTVGYSEICRNLLTLFQSTSWNFTVPEELPLEKFINYLNDRNQFVRYQIHDSEYKNINCVVPQVSILGPLLFFFYIVNITSFT